VKDTHVHAEKTNFGISLAFGKTVATGCGKRREKGRTSTDPAEITCPECREWGAREELVMAENAEVVAGLPGDFLARHGPATREDFEALASKHRAAAREWRREQENGTP
jgi:hypothetical protein